MQILHLEDNPLDADLVRDVLATEFHDCTINGVDTREEFIAALSSHLAPDLILSDFSLPAFDGLSALAIARDKVPGIPFVFLSGSIGEERAIAAVRAGAYDYVLKDNMARLCVVVRRAIDDSRRRRLAEANQKRMIELAGIIERATEAIVVSDLAGRITLWNDGAAKLYGIPAEETVGRPAEEVLSGVGLGQPREAAKGAADAQEERRESAVTTRDGRALVVDFRTTLVRDASGRPQGRIVLATDITEKKKLEEQFLRAQRVESLGMLAAGIAHDFNNVLAPLDMVAALLRLHLTDPNDLGMIEIVEKSAQRGAGLVRQILGFARGASGELQLTELADLLHDIGNFVRASFPRCIVLEMEVSSGLRPVRANPTQIHQVLLNLAINARDAMMPTGGRLTIRAENRTLDAAAAKQVEGARPGEFVLLEVADTGTGMPPEVLARIWEPFFTTKGSGKGTGLGLAAVRGIAAAHGGFLAVRTAIGRGTAFSIFLPVAKPRETAASGAPNAPQGNGELLLVVDDEAAIRAVTVSILNHHGYRTLDCDNGAEAIALFRQHSAEIRAVLTDLKLPNMSGPALAAALLELRADLPILAMTGGGREAETVRAAAFSAKLQKPFAAADLAAAVHRLLSAAAVPGT